MLKKSSTEDNLSSITRSIGRRQSLEMNNEYLESSASASDDDSSTLNNHSQKDSNDEIKPHQHDSKANGTTTTLESLHENDINLKFRGNSFESSSSTATAVDIEGAIALSNSKPVKHLLDEMIRTSKTRLNRKRSELHHHKYVSPLGDIRFNSISSTIFDSQDFKESQFFGFYVLFWLGTAFYMMNLLVHAYFVKSESILEWPIVILLRQDLLKVGLTDLGMYLSTYFVFYVQYACKSNYISWERAGWILQSVYEVAFLRFWLWFASDAVMGFTWIAKVFLVLHSLVFIMKMHSYGFYNGYLWKIMKELQFSERYLAKLNNDPDLKIPEGYTTDQLKTTLKESIAFCKFDLEYQSHATTVKSDVYKFDEKRIDLSLEALQEKKIIIFPSNISLFNFFEYSSFPTVVYTLHYPRNERIRWSYVFQKTCAVFGIIFLMILVAQNWMHPLVLQCIEVRKLPVQERFSRYIFILLDMIPPFLMEYLFTFFLIWDSILNAIAELTRFADREFYGPWWSCTDWSEFSRIWNVPVHKFLLRHVYHSSISSFKVNKFQAALLTFIISSIVHELVMYVIFGTLRGYLLLLQMSQIPLVMFSRTAFMKDKKVLGNIICWFGFLSGPSMICTLYLTY